MKHVALAAALALTSVAVVPAVHAASVAPAAVEYETVFENVGFVDGYDGFTQKINIDGGNYRLTLTDFNFSDSFAELGVMLTSATQLLYKLEKPGLLTAANGANDIWQNFIDFNLSAGQYYLSFNGKSAGDLSFYGVSLAQHDLAPVPVPAAFILFGSGLLAMAGLARRRTA